MKRGATTELNNHPKKIKYDLIELQRQFDDLTSTIDKITNENRAETLEKIYHFVSTHPIEQLEVNNFLQIFTKNIVNLIANAQASALCIEILEKIISKNIEKIDWNTSLNIVELNSSAPLFVLIIGLLEETRRFTLPVENTTFLMNVLNEFIANPKLKIDWAFQISKVTDNNCTIPVWGMLLDLAHVRELPEFLQNFIYNCQHHGAIARGQFSNIPARTDANESPVFRALAGKLCLLNKNFPHDSLKKEIDVIVNNLSAKLWHFNNVCKDLPEDIVKILNCHIIIEELNDYLTDGTKEQKEAFAWYLLTSGRFNYQPEQAEIDKGNVDSASLQNVLDKKSYDFTSIFATRDYRDMRPISQLALFSHPHFNSTVYKRISNALDDLRNERKLPSFLNCYQRQNITHAIASMNDDFTLADIKKTIQSAMK